IVAGQRRVLEQCDREGERRLEFPKPPRCCLEVGCDVSSLTYKPFQVKYDHTNGHAPSQTPGQESFWVKSTTGAGNVTLAWRPRPGSWRAVLMNADGSRGVTVELQLGARTSLLWWLGGRLLGAAPVAVGPRPLSEPARAPPSLEAT